MKHPAFFPSFHLNLVATSLLPRRGEYSRFRVHKTKHHMKVERSRILRSSQQQQIHQFLKTATD